jgi:asparagine synthase (glutamine-hydrolysing)
VDELLSEESLRKTGYFDAPAVLRWRKDFRGMRPGSNQRTAVELGLVGVVATQLWHHLHIDGSLANLPTEMRVQHHEPAAVNGNHRPQAPRRSASVDALRR